MKAVVDRIVQYANRYRLTDVSTGMVLGTFDFDEVTGTVQQIGTEIDKELFDSIADDLAKMLVANGGNSKDLVVTFTESTALENIASGEKHSTIFGKLRKWFTDRISKLKGYTYDSNIKITKTDTDETIPSTADLTSGTLVVQKAKNADYATSATTDKNGKDITTYIAVETDPTVPGWAKNATKPTYTKAEVGLGNVDNTADEDKPVSTATQNALSAKVDKVSGKQLSTNDYTTAEKQKLSRLAEDTVRYGEQSLTDTQRSQARSNIGAGTSDFDGTWGSLSGKPTIPPVNNGTLTIQKNGETLGTFTANQSGNSTINISVDESSSPSKHSQSLPDVVSGTLYADISTLYGDNKVGWYYGTKYDAIKGFPSSSGLSDGLPFSLEVTKGLSDSGIDSYIQILRWNNAIYTREITKEETTVTVKDWVQSSKIVYTKLTDKNLNLLYKEENVGWYYAELNNTCTGVPASTKGLSFSLEICKIGTDRFWNEDKVMQILRTDEDTFIRTLSSNVDTVPISSWEKLVTSANIPTSVDGLTGGTISGNTNINGTLKENDVEVVTVNDLATTSSNGLMSSTDKTKLDGLEPLIQIKVSSTRKWYDEQMDTEDDWKRYKYNINCIVVSGLNSLKEGDRFQLCYLNLSKYTIKDKTRKRHRYRYRSTSWYYQVSQADIENSFERFTITVPYYDNSDEHVDKILTRNYNARETFRRPLIIRIQRCENIKYWGDGRTHHWTVSNICQIATNCDSLNFRLIPI